LRIVRRQPIPDWVSCGASVSELANKLGIDPQRLDETVRRFNQFAATGVDEIFIAARSVGRSERPRARQ